MINHLSIFSFNCEVNIVNKFVKIAAFSAIAVASTSSFAGLFDGAVFRPATPWHNVDINVCSWAGNRQMVFIEWASEGKKVEGSDYNIKPGQCVQFTIPSKGTLADMYAGGVHRQVHTGVRYIVKNQGNGWQIYEDRSPNGSGVREGLGNNDGGCGPDGCG